MPTVHRASKAPKPKAQTRKAAAKAAAKTGHHNRPDLTLRNLDAGNRRLGIERARITNLAEQVATLTAQVHTLSEIAGIAQRNATAIDRLYKRVEELTEMGDNLSAAIDSTDQRAADLTVRVEQLATTGDAEDVVE